MNLSTLTRCRPSRRWAVALLTSTWCLAACQAKDVPQTLNAPTPAAQASTTAANVPAKTIAGLEFVFIELPKFKPETSTDKRMARLWLRFMNEIGDSGLQIPDPSLTEIPEIAQALELMEESALSPAELAGYHHSLDEWRTTVTIKHDAHTKGKEEATIAIALALKAQGVDTTVIMAATGLSAADVAGL
jgi:predicted transposase/invertase (TIGR01784 family)